jgi:hypothetical protein
MNESFQVLRLIRGPEKFRTLFIYGSGGIPPRRETYDPAKVFDGGIMSHFY